MDLLAGVLLAFTFGLSLASFILLCFLWIKVNKHEQEITYIAIRNAELARELARLQDEVHTTGRLEAFNPEGARERATRRTQKLREEGGF